MQTLASAKEEDKDPLRRRFDAIFSQGTTDTSLNLLLARLHKNKSELLLVLERPDIPLHTNGSEGDIRGHVVKEKISGGTRSDLGRKCRDTFFQLEEDLPQARHLVLGLAGRPDLVRRSDPGTRSHHRTAHRLRINARRTTALAPAL